jgi:hypothetical protein
MDLDFHFYINPKEKSKSIEFLFIYHESWSTAVIVSDTHGNGLGGTDIIAAEPDLSFKGRIEYDEFDRVKRLITYFKSSGLTTSNTNWYDAKGHLKDTSSKEIRDNQFWDE